MLNHILRIDRTPSIQKPSSLYYSQLSQDQGFTLIELLIVMTIVGSLMALTYQLLQSVWSSEFSSTTSAEVRQLFPFAKSKALDTGKIISLEIDFTERTMGLMYYLPTHETAQEDTLQELLQDNIDSSYRLKKFAKSREEQEENQDDSINSNQPEWLVEPTSLPSNLIALYSGSGFLLSSKKVYIHFYPNGTSDSIILEFDQAQENRFLYIPRSNLAPQYLDSLDHVQGK